MSHLKSDAEAIRTTRNTARFFTENRHISWVLLLGTVAWGVLGYLKMPQRKDPDVQAREAVAMCAWPGAPVDKVEPLITRRLEQKVAENSNVEEVRSITRTGIAIVFVKLRENVADRGKEFDDVAMKLNTITGLPEGSRPIQFIKDFGDTAALMLTVASPKASGVEIDLKARDVAAEIARVRGGQSGRVSVIGLVPDAVPADVVHRSRDLFLAWARETGFATDVRPLEGPRFVGLDGVTSLSDAELAAGAARFIEERLRASELHPDTWKPIVVREVSGTREAIAAAAGDKYTYRQMDDFTDLIVRTLQGVPQVAKVTRSGVLDERVILEFSQEKLASYGIPAQVLQNALGARNITAPGGVVEVGSKSVTVDPSGEFQSEKEIGDVQVARSKSGSPVYLRDLVNVVRAYDSPPRFLNNYGHRAADGSWQRTRAITLSVQMRSGEKIGDLGAAVDAALSDVKSRLPEDLVLARTSDQPLQVEESVHLFMSSLYEAIALVVLVSLVGFWEWRSALLMAVSIPITLAMTFGLMSLLGIDLQQVSIASLIIALGLLVDDPVVAGDAIKRDLALGHPPLVSAWLGPTKLATAILYATITNIVAYLPFLLIGGDTGQFIKSLPIVIGASLVASRLVSMTFIPLLGYYLLKPKAEKSIEERRKSGFAAWYYKVGMAAIEHRKAVLAGSMVLLVIGGLFAKSLKQQFFPKDYSYLSYVDVWLPEDAPFSATAKVAAEAEDVIRRTAEEFGKKHGSQHGPKHEVLESLTTFIGGSGPRFWSSVVPELTQLNYAQIIIQTIDKHDTGPLVAELQTSLSAEIAGARVDVRQLETGAPIGIPVSIRVSGEDVATLRAQAARLETILRETPGAVRVRNDWGAESFSVKLKIDPDRAAMAGITNLDVATSSAAGLNGHLVGSLRDGEKQIPIVARLRMEERARLSDVEDLYVGGSQGTQRVPLGLVSTVGYELQTEKLQRRDHFRTITVSAFPATGVLPSEVLNAAFPKIREVQRTLPPGYKLVVAGEYKEQQRGFKDLATVMAISVGMIYLALVVQFKNAVKPLIVFAAIPFGIVGAFLALGIMKAPFGFMAFLGIASLIGVIVSHVIVLFDFIEEKHAEGEPLEQALLDAGIMRLRPVLITVGATVIALFPLASHGGPLWEPMCYAQIGGLTAATFITLLMVPVLYAVFVKDLKLVRWEQVAEAHEPDAPIALVAGGAA